MAETATTPAPAPAPANDASTRPTAKPKTEKPKGCAGDGLEMNKGDACAPRDYEEPGKWYKCYFCEEPVYVEEADLDNSDIEV